MIYIKFDLHIHTKYSDGLLDPSNVVDLAFEKGLDGLSITDHDTVSGLKETENYIKSNYKNQIKFIPGIEFGCIYGEEEIHILGYFIDYNDSRLLNLIDKLKSSRINRSKKMIQKINELGFHISFEEIFVESNDNFIGRPHIARAMVKKGYVDDISDAFKKYIGIGKPAYVDRFKLEVEDTIELINEIGGIAILAHPGLLKDKTNINRCIEWGINGLECIHSEHSDTQVNQFIEICKENDLKITGGSDCHGQIIKGELLLGNYYVELDNIYDLKNK